MDIDCSYVTYCSCFIFIRIVSASGKTTTPFPFPLELWENEEHSNFDDIFELVLSCLLIHGNKMKTIASEVDEMRGKIQDLKTSLSTQYAAYEYIFSGRAVYCDH